jgi:hypothetical protein
MIKCRIRSCEPGVLGENPGYYGGNGEIRVALPSGPSFSLF